MDEEKMTEEMHEEYEDIMQYIIRALQIKYGEYFCEAMRDFAVVILRYIGEEKNKEENIEYIAIETNFKESVCKFGIKFESCPGVHIVFSPLPFCQEDYKKYFKKIMDDMDMVKKLTDKNKLH